MAGMASEPTRFPVWIPTTLCVVLCAGLVYDHRQTTRRAEQSAAGLQRMSNLWHTASQKLEEQRAVNQTLEQDLAASNKPVAGFPASSNASISPESVVPAVATAQGAQPDPRLAQLEEERDELTGKLNNLTKSLCDVQTEMSQTQRRLDASEGDRDALLRQLKRLQSQKSKLEEQFNNLAALREQMHRLREEQVVSRRLEWIRRGLYGQSKGSELLRRSLASAPPPSANYNLDVELRRSGDPKVLSHPN
jgi:DNA repair exonuclease SbcCD ATPase subunit